MLPATCATQATPPPRSALDLLLSRFPGQILLSIADCATVMSIRPRTIYNNIHVGAFPVPTTSYGARRLVDIRDLADYLDATRVAAKNTPDTPVEQKRGRGRPRKVASGVPA